MAKTFSVEYMDKDPGNKHNLRDVEGFHVWDNALQIVLEKGCIIIPLHNLNYFRSEE